MATRSPRAHRAAHHQAGPGQSGDTAASALSASTLPQPRPPQTPTRRIATVLDIVIFALSTALDARVTHGERAAENAIARMEFTRAFTVKRITT